MNFQKFKLFFNTKLKDEISSLTTVRIKHFDKLLNLMSLNKIIALKNVKFLLILLYFEEYLVRKNVTLPVSGNYDNYLNIKLFRALK